MLRNHFSKTVSILNYLTRLARHPRLLRRPLPDQRNVGLQRSVPSPMWSLTFRSAPLTHFSFYASWFSSTRLSWGFKVGRDPILSMVLLMRLSRGFKVGRDPILSVVLLTCLSRGFKVGRDPILSVVLLTRLSRGLEVGRDPLSFVVLFLEQLIPVD